jgi:hypothetical protein
MPRRVPWHERIKLLGWLRRPFRAAWLGLFRRTLASDDGKRIAAGALRGLLAGRPPALDGVTAETAAPYEDLGRPRWEGQPALRRDAVFITGRFRSGSTLLWNLFRNLDGFTSYYEPLNERRWFDPAARGDRIDPTHRKVSAYWEEYEGLNELAASYRERWTDHDLLMGEDFWDPDLKRYVEVLIARAPGRPALQFNRVDFRLPWLRRHFPGARVVHLYRHPRDQWCSSLLDVKCFPRDGLTADFAPHDKFYLRAWAADLKYHFPFLDERAAEHPYQLFYYIWKLSYLFGRKYAHHSLAFERLVADPAAELTRLFGVLDVAHYDLGRLRPLVVAPALGKWKEYADDAWFRRHEEGCETVLADFLGHVPVP